ncbi:DinB family protein [Nocardioides sp.]|uniref:DinB family protein n=1 Tax=Nocardioides sp. TaxID=35761 RepID=UPI0039E5D2F2
MSEDPKATLQHYLQRARDGLVMKLDGLSERELRLPRTPTGTSLLGIVKHVLNVEYGYLGLTFGREFPTPGELLPLSAYDTDPQADWYATEDETAAGLLDLYRRVWAFSDETIAQLPLDAPGRVPWWPVDGADVTLHHIVVRVIDDTSRHAGQADILREHIDGAVGLNPAAPNIPDDYDWPAYVARLTDLADRF